MKIPQLMLHSLFAAWAIHRSMVIIVVLIHVLPWDHISTMLTLQVKVASAVCRMQRDVRRRNLSVTVRAGGGGDGGIGGVGSGGGHGVQVLMDGHCDPRRDPSRRPNRTSPNQGVFVGGEEQRG